MRILQLHNHHASLGGAMEVLAHERVLLEQGGHAVDQYTLPATEDLHLSAVRAGAKAVWNVEASRDVAARIRTFRPDVVHVHTPFPLMSPAVFRTAAKAGVPALTTLHSYRYSCVAGTCVRDERICEDCVGSRVKLSGVRHRCYHDNAAASAALTIGLGLHRALGTFHRDVSRYLTLTGFARDLLIRDGYPADKITVKPNSVPDPGPPQLTDRGEPFVMFAGRLIEIKGVRTLLDAWSAVHPPPGVVLRIAGDGPLRPLVEERAANDPSIEFLGWVGEDEITSLFARAACVVVPSEWYEGLPMVILRSLSVGTPVVVSDLENFAADVVADSTGWTFATGDSQSLAARFSAVLADPSEMQQRRPIARASYERRYSPSVDLERLETVYTEVIAERR